MVTRRSITLGPNDDGRRLDRVLRKALPGVPVGRIFRALRERDITLNGRHVTGDVRVSEGDTLEIASTVSGAQIDGPDAARPAGVSRADSRLRGRIRFENDRVVVVDKEAGELTHGPDSLEDLVRAYLADRSAGGISFTPGPAHRLDRNTSGLVIFGVSLEGAQAAANAIAQRAITKRYVALFEGRIDATVWDESLVRDRTARTTGIGARPATRGDGGRAPHGPAAAASDAAQTGRNALTRVDPVASAALLRSHPPARTPAAAGGSIVTLAVVTIVTGRTHQIRAHGAIHGHPLAGDRKYGSTAGGGYLLHAASLTAAGAAAGALGFEHVWSAVPQRFERRIVDLFGQDAAEAVRDLISRPAAD